MIFSKKFDFFILIVLMITGVIIVNIIGKETSWDFAAYHYYSVYALLHNRMGFDIMPSGIQSYLNPALDIPFYFLVKYFNDYPRIVMSIQSLYWAFTSFLVYLIAKKIFIAEHKIFFAVFSTIIGATAFTPILENGTTWNDLPICIMFFIVLLIFANYLFTEDSLKRTIWLTAAGFILGMAVGLKSSAVLFLIGIIMSLIFLSPTFTGGGTSNHNKNKFEFFKFNLLKTFKVIILFTIAVIVGYFITNGYWMYILYSKFQNPFFPYYNNIFKSEYAPLLNFMDTRHLPHNIFERIFYPFFFMKFNYVIEFDHIDYRYPLLYISIFIILTGNIFAALKKNSFFSKKLNEYVDVKFFNFLTLVLIFSYIQWVKSSGILRYILPIEFLCGIYFAIVLIYIAILAKNNRIAKIIAIIMLGVFLTTTKNEEWWKTRNLYVEPNGKKYKFLEIPNLQLPDNAVVLELGGYPTQIFIPFQNPKAQFIYIFGECDNYEFVYNEKMRQEIQNIIKDKNKEIYLLYSVLDAAPINWDRVKEFVNPDMFDCNKIQDFSLEYVLNSNVTFYFCKAKT
ncbi:MAG: hypothetical protein ACI37T_01525 [Candidatus Gastranaerophilaceae bacterium]